MFWVIFSIIMLLLFVPAIVAFSKMPQRDKTKARIVICILALLAFVPGLNILVLLGIIVYLGVQWKNEEMDRG